MSVRCTTICYDCQNKRQVQAAHQLFEPNDQRAAGNLSTMSQTVTESTKLTIPRQLSGMRFVKIDYDKVCIDPLRTPVRDPERLLHEGENIGLLLGENGLVDIETDGDGPDTEVFLADLRLPP